MLNSTEISFSLLAHFISKQIRIVKRSTWPDRKKTGSNILHNCRFYSIKTAVNHRDMPITHMASGSDYSCFYKGLETIWSWHYIWHEQRPFIICLFEECGVYTSRIIPLGESNAHNVILVATFASLQPRPTLQNLVPGGQLTGVENIP